MNARSRIRTSIFSTMLFIIIFIILPQDLLANDIEINPWDLAYLENFGKPLKLVTKPPVELIHKPPLTNEAERALKEDKAYPNLKVQPKPTCEDKAANCIAIQQQCTESSYDEMMLANCAKTCGYCECRDLSSRCAYWDINGFCNSLIHTDNFKKKKCAKTCHLCNRL